jgi:hypothetical protein
MSSSRLGFIRPHQRISIRFPHARVGSEKDRT